ncbi:MarR family transcriptional regulator [Fulvivirga ulvae]|uniref:GbsR/MarR family transcriptional regulator n=1 Tax=Fulvivirga ulvae TaxID=2904245 RepID=UPI001F3439F2|nr:MarR family transcriptional regulator [Fulvivirga ulvae]UII33725.1 MarR family transcriptional regulator [Fulvivirga ulvae]
MKYQEAKDKFILAWGSLGSSWGVSRTMAQIHALLLISTSPLSTEDIMEELQISRGNANQNIRALMDWGLVEKELKAGERREYFMAGKDIWELAKQVAKERKKRELEPMLKVLNQLQDVDGDSKEVKEFKEVTKNISDFAGQAESTLNLFINSKQNWFYKLLSKITL